jgi:hypothetical protein
VIQQSDTRNTATCSEHSGTVQHCSITQTGTRNFARVDQLVKDSSSADETATQTADVLQQGATQMNELQLDQDVDQSATDALTQMQDVHQYVEVNQTATLNGNNFIHVHQAENQDETGSATEQDQDTRPLSTTLAGDAATTAADCKAASSANHVPDPNSCATINQMSQDGDNDAHLHQLANQNEKSSAAAPTQTQGTPSDGLGGGFEQTVTGLGSNHNETVQHKQQQAHASGGTQTQNDPIGCCGISQNGGHNDRDDVNGFVTQSASGGTYTQAASLFGTSDVASGPDVSTTSSSTGPSSACSVSHHVRQNDATTAFNQNAPAPCSLTFVTACASSNAPATAASASTQPGTCTTQPIVPPCPPEVLFCDGLSGATLPALDVTAEPASYSLPSWYVSF